MNPYAPPKAAEKIMNERTANTSHEWRREKRRMSKLIRQTRPIANYPEIVLRTAIDTRAPRARHDDAGCDLAKCLRRDAFAPPDENSVNARLTPKNLSLI